MLVIVITCVVSTDVADGVIVIVGTALTVITLLAEWAVYPLASVTDSAGYIAYSANSVITVTTAPTISITPSSTAIDAGQFITITNTVLNGVAPFTYSYTVNSLSGVTIGSNKITFNNAGTFNVLEDCVCVS